MRALFVLIGALVLSAAACGSGGSSHDASACGAPVIWSTTCQACLDDHCCSQVMACAHDQACQAFLTCGSGCGMDGSCLINCYPSGAAANSPSAQVIDCIQASCANVCS